MKRLPASELALFPHGFTLVQWLESTPPPQEYLQSSVISQPLIFTTQICHYLSLLESGFAHEKFFASKGPLAGHSQGIMTALFVSEQWGKTDFCGRATEYARYFLFQGLYMQRSFAGFYLPQESKEKAREDGAGDPTAMASIRIDSREQLQSAVDELCANVVISLSNTPIHPPPPWEPAPRHPGPSPTD